MDDSVESIRFGERGFCGVSSSLDGSGLSPLTAAGAPIDGGDNGVFTVPKYDPPDGGAAAGVKLKLPRANPLLFSDCFLNCSNSGFCSTGIIRGDAAAVERTLEVGGLQFPRMCCAALDEKWSLAFTASWK